MYEPLRDGSDRPVRPSVPPILAFSLLLWLALFCTFPLLQDIEGQFCVIGMAASPLPLLLLRVRRLKVPLLRLAIIAFSAAVFLACLQSFDLKQEMERYSELDIFQAKIELLEDPKEADYGLVCVKARVFVAGDNVSFKHPVNLYIKDFEGCLLRGDCLAGTLEIKQIKDSPSDWYWTNGYVGQGTLSNPMPAESSSLLVPLYTYRRSLIESIEDRYSEDVSFLLEALICGYRTNLNDTDIYLRFRTVGLAHMIAVSGAHLSIVASFGLLFISRVCKKKSISSLLLAAMIAAYLVIAAIPISALRAAMMFYCCLFSFVGKRRASSLNALGVCIVIILFGDPRAASSISFQLSAGATLGILLFSALFEWFLRKLVRWRFLRSGFGMTFAALSATLLLSASYFDMVPFIGPLSNIVCTPLLTVICSFNLVFSMLLAIIPPEWTLLMELSALPVRALSWCVEILARIPYASIPFSCSQHVAILVSAAIMLWLWYRWYRMRVSHVAGAVCVCFAGTLIFAMLLPWIRGPELIMLDVGQGDAFVLRDPTMTMLIDTGNQDRKLKSGLADCGVMKIDYVLITHPDDDHCGSLRALLGFARVEQVLLAQTMQESAASEQKARELVEVAEEVAGKQPTLLAVGDSLQSWNYVSKVVWPDAFNAEDENANSLTLYVQVDADRDGRADATILLCGDAEADILESLVYEGRIGSCTVFKCGHHGSENSVSSALLEAIDPQVTLISVGAENRYGHPTEQTLELLVVSGSLIFRTDEDSAVTVKFRNDSLIVDRGG